MKKTAKFIAAAALCGLSAVFSACQEPPMEPQTQNHRLHASPETVAKLGAIAQKLPSWADADVILVDQDDLRLNADEKHSLNFILYMARMNRAIGGPLVERAVGPYLERHIDSLPGLRGAEVMKSMPERTREAIAAFLSWRAGGARGFVPRENGGNKFCIMALPPFNAKTAAGMVSQMTGIDEEDLENIPGTAQDWMMLIMAHETQHCRQNLDDDDRDINAIIGYETMADQYGMIVYFNELSKGFTTSAYVPAAYASVRAIRTVAMRDDAHATHINLDPLRRGAGNVGHWRSAVSRSDMVEIYRKIDERIARDLNTDMNGAYMFAASNPNLLYKAVENLNREGAFAGNPRAQEMVAYFLVAARIHAPKHFGLAPAP